VTSQPALYPPRNPESGVDYSSIRLRVATLLVRFVGKKRPGEAFHFNMGFQRRQDYKGVEFL